MSKHSTNYLKVKKYFEDSFWTKKMVLNAVDKWITKDEADEILRVANQEEGELE